MSEVVYWVDANVLLRFLTGEPPALAERAERILEKAQGGELKVLFGVCTHSLIHSGR